MEDLKIYGLSFGAILFSVINQMNPYLQTVVLITSIIYTILRIVQNLKDDGKD